MKKITIMQLGDGLVSDSATWMKGMLTHCHINPAGHASYVFQPNGLNPETGHPLDRTFIDESRIRDGHAVDIEVPLEVLGTLVEDKASGLKGTAVGLVLHMSGCIHVDIQPNGRVAKTGAAPERIDIDIRRLKGNKIPKLTKAERAADQAKKPSPMAMPSTNSCQAKKLRPMSFQETNSWGF
jgi:hypothetical protein